VVDVTQTAQTEISLYFDIKPLSSQQHHIVEGNYVHRNTFLRMEVCLNELDHGKGLRSGFFCTGTSILCYRFVQLRNTGRLDKQLRSCGGSSKIKYFRETGKKIFTAVFPLYSQESNGNESGQEINFSSADAPAPVNGNRTENIVSSNCDPLSMVAKGVVAKSGRLIVSGNKDVVKGDGLAGPESNGDITGHGLFGSGDNGDSESSGLVGSGNSRMSRFRSKMGSATKVCPQPTSHEATRDGAAAVINREPEMTKEQKTSSVTRDPQIQDDKKQSNNASGAEASSSSPLLNSVAATGMSENTSGHKVISNRSARGAGSSSAAVRDRSVRRLGGESEKNSVRRISPISSFKQPAKVDSKALAAMPKALSGLLNTSHCVDGGDDDGSDSPDEDDRQTAVPKKTAAESLLEAASKELSTGEENPSLLEDLEQRAYKLSQKSPHSGLKGKRLSFLVVEDCPVSRKCVTRLLVNQGQRVSVAFDGFDCLKLIESAATRGNNYDVILMNGDMPFMDGKKTTAIIREKGLNMLIFGLTAEIRESEIKKFCDAGAQCVLQKPLDVADLSRKLIEFMPVVDNTGNLQSFFVETAGTTSTDSKKGGDAVKDNITVSDKIVVHNKISKMSAPKAAVDNT